MIALALYSNGVRHRSDSSASVYFEYYDSVMNICREIFRRRAVVLLNLACARLYVKLGAREALDGERHVSEETAIKLCAYANVLEHNVKKRKRDKTHKT